MIEIEYLDYDGLVYDLQVVEDESFVVNGVIAHNCSMIPIIPGFEVAQGETGEEWFNRQPPEVQREMMGPGRYEAWEQGKFEFGQLAATKDNSTWGPSVQVAPLKDLLKPL